MRITRGSDGQGLIIWSYGIQWQEGGFLREDHKNKFRGVVAWALTGDGLRLVSRHGEAGWDDVEPANEHEWESLDGPADLV